LNPCQRINDTIKHMLLSRCLWSFYMIVLLVSCEKKEKETTTDSGFIKSGQFLGDYYPTDAWRECAPSEVGMDPDMLNDLGNKIKELVKSGNPIDGILIAKNGYIVGEYYSPDYSSDTTKHVIHSCTKSFTSACVGIAIDEGFIAGVNEKILQYFSEYEIDNLTEQKEAITIENLLTMSAGLDWNELDLSYSDPGNAFYQWRNSDDHIGFILDRPMEYTPGTVHDYNSGLSDLISVIVRKATGVRLDSFAVEHILNPIGIKDYYWEIDRDGHANGYGQMRLSSRNMARFGYLYLKKGMWENEQIISQNWITESGRSHIQAQHNVGVQNYGYHFWVSDFGMYTAMGYRGQWIMILPEINMVVVFTNNFTPGDGEQWMIPINLLQDYIIPAVL
jgi:CubicO group peptidase (beta-lactamase class C family)